MYKDFPIDYVQDIIEASNSIFHSIYEKDFQGVHAIIEIIVGEKPINQSFGAHIISNKDCLEKENNYEISIAEYNSYLKKFELPVLIFVINEDIGEGYWQEFNDSYIKEQNFLLRKDKRNMFSFKSYNTVIIDFFLNKKKTYFLIESFLLQKDNEYLKAFLISIFKIVDFSIPVIMENKSLSEFLESLNIQVEKYPTRKPEMMTKAKAIDIRVINNYLWYFKATDGKFTISTCLFEILTAKYKQMVEQ